MHFIFTTWLTDKSHFSEKLLYCTEPLTEEEDIPQKINDNKMKQCDMRDDLSRTVLLSEFLGYTVHFQSSGDLLPFSSLHNMLSMMYKTSLKNGTVLDCSS